MKKYINILLLPVFGLFVFSGCAGLKNLTAFNVTDVKGERVLVRYFAPEKSWKCKRKGKETYSPEIMNILGIDFKDNPDDAEMKSRKELTSKSHRYNANYIDLESISTTYVIVYGWGNDGSATYYRCKNLPAKKK